MDSFLKAVEASLSKKPTNYNIDRLTSYAGYPVVHAKDLGLMDYFAANGRNVGGMAWGGSTNPEGQGKGEPSVIVPNPYYYKDNPRGYNALVKIEASRHWMDENSHQPSFKITPEMQKWREQNFANAGEAGKAYLNDDDTFRKTVVSRFFGGDANVPPTTPELQSDIDTLRKRLEAANAALKPSIAQLK